MTERFRFYPTVEAMSVLRARRKDSSAGINSLICNYDKIVNSLLPRMSAYTWVKVINALGSVRLHSCDKDSLGIVRDLLDTVIRGFADDLTDAQIIAIIDMADRWSGAPLTIDRLTTIIPQEKLI